VIHVRTGGRGLKVVNGVSFDIKSGEFFALIGESGSGKTMIARAIMRLIPDQLIKVDGSILVGNIDAARAPERVLRRMRGTQMAMIFQEPMTSLNPLMTVGAQIAEAMDAHGRQPAAVRRERLLQLLADVQFRDPERTMRLYPHEISGGMRQRVMIAMALANNPRLLIADEPTTALDVTIQREIMEILGRLARKYNVAILFISHDLSLVGQYADRIGVLYGGVLMELGPAEQVILSPLHPYTAALVACVPRRRTDNAVMTGIDGVVPSPARWPDGCRFAARCSYAGDACVGSAVSFNRYPGMRMVRCIRPFLGNASDLARGASE